MQDKDLFLSFSGIVWTSQTLALTTLLPGFTQSRLLISYSFKHDNCINVPWNCHKSFLVDLVISPFLTFSFENSAFWLLELVWRCQHIGMKVLQWMSFQIFQFLSFNINICLLTRHKLLASYSMFCLCRVSKSSKCLHVHTCWTLAIAGT